MQLDAAVVDDDDEDDGDDATSNAASSGSFLSKASMLTKLDFLSFVGEAETDGMGEAIGGLFSRDTVREDDDNGDAADDACGVDDSCSNAPLSEDTAKVGAVLGEDEKSALFDIAANMDKGVDDKTVVAVDDIVFRKVGDSNTQLC